MNDNDLKPVLFLHFKIFNLHLLVGFLEINEYVFVRDLL